VGNHAEEGTSERAWRFVEEKIKGGEHGSFPSQTLMRREVGNEPCSSAIKSKKKTRGNETPVHL